MDEVKIGGFIDTETTGLNPDEEEIVEFSIVLFSYDPLTGEIFDIEDTYTGLREPDVPIKRAASEIHGIYKRKVKGMELDYERINSLIERADILISHNALFDHDFVCNDYNIEGFEEKDWYCSMNGIPWKKYGFRSKGLQNLLRDHGIKAEEAHRAEDDSMSAIKLLSEENEHGITYLKELLSRSPEIKRSARSRKNKLTYEINLNLQAADNESDELDYSKDRPRTFTEKIAAILKNKYFWLVVLIIIGMQDENGGTNGFLAAIITWAFILLGIKIYRKKREKNQRVL